MKLRLLSLSLVMAFGLSACSKERVAAKSFEKFYKDQTGETIKIEKLFTLVDGVTVFKNKGTGEYVAFNTAKFNKDTMTTLDQYLAVANQPSDVVHNLTERAVTTTVEHYHEAHWETEQDPIYDNNGNQTGYVEHSYYVEGYYTETSSTVYYYDGGGFTFSENNSQNKDLDAIAANIEDANNAGIANSIVAKFGLSEERAESLANLAVNYANLENSRRLTTADKEVFAKKALNLSFNDLQSAYKSSAQGNSARYNTLISQAAQFNGMSPEKARELMDLYFSEQQ